MHQMIHMFIIFLRNKEKMGFNNKLRQEQVKIAYESMKWLEKYSDNKDYQMHLYNLVELIKLTEMELIIRTK